MRHSFTREECQRGGWERARQIAQLRRDHPTIAERDIRRVVKSLGVKYRIEYEIYTQFPQWIDIMILEPRMVAVEVDGSRDWHNSGYSSKMSQYDDLKRQWCESHNVDLVQINYPRLRSLDEAREVICQRLNQEKAGNQLENEHSNLLDGI